MKPGILTHATWIALLITGCGREGGRSPAPVSAAKSEVSSTRISIPAGSGKLSGIQVAAVRMAELPCDEISAPGKVEANPNRIARVVMPTAGRIRQVHVRLGDAVSEGQALVTIESPDAGEATAAYRQALSEMRKARAALEKAKMDLGRFKDLYEHRAAALKDVQNAQNEQTQSEAAVEQAQASRDSAVHRLEVLGLNPDQASRQITARAPISGKVLEIAVATGEFRNDTSANLMTIVDLSSVWMAADVPESSIRLIDVGEAVQVDLVAYPGEVFRGRVMRIADTVEPATRSIKVQTELDNRKGRLRPEMFGTIRHSHGACRTPVVPLSAIVHNDSGSTVFVEKSPGEFEQMPVRTREVRGGLVPVLAGVNENDRVVVEGAVLLKGQPGGRP